MITTNKTPVQSIFNKLREVGLKMMDTKINDKEVQIIDDCLLRELTWSDLRKIVDLVDRGLLIIDTSKEIKRPKKYEDMQCEEYSIDDFGYMKLSMCLAYVLKGVGSVIYCYDDNNNEYTFISYVELDKACCEILCKYDNVNIDMIM